MVKVGSGSLQYELVEGWEQLPEGWSHPDVAGVATDSQGRVYMLCRGDHPVIIYDRDGKFLDAWGEGDFTKRAHGAYIGKNDALYLTDDAHQTIRQYTLDGKLLMTLGTPFEASDTGYTGEVESITHGGPPFNRPCNLAVSPSGDLFAADGYGNCRVHVFSNNGQLLRSWGDPGVGPGQFHCVHGIWVHSDGRVFVCDRENDRIQIFSPSGEFLAEWLDVQRPCNIYIDDKGLVYVGELVYRKGAKSIRLGSIDEERPSRVTIYDLEGNILLRWGGLDAAAPGNFVAPHDIWVDDRGDIYVAEVTFTIGARRGFVPPDTHTFQKFARI
jgi:DNA-binding beta-propeller fold protein YncE